MGWIRESWLAVLLLTASCGICDTNILSDTNMFGGQKPLIFKGLINSRLTSTNKPYRNPPNDTVLHGLRWLVSSQNRDGSWGDKADELEASTGLALLAFFGHGETPSSTEFGKPIGRGLRYLISIQQATNLTDHADQAKAISHAISTWAICQGYALTSIPFLRSNGEAGLQTIVKQQRTSGLWDLSYRTGDGGDDLETSIWQVLALKNGLTMGSEEKGLRESLGKASESMKRVIETKPDNGTIVGAVVCLQLCREGSSLTCRTGLKALETTTPDWESPSFKDPVFRWYLMNQAFFYQGGQLWARWDRLLLPMLVNHQIIPQEAEGKKIGYWISPGKNERFGKVYSTALSLLMLEVYYQFNPPNRLPTGNFVTDSTNDVVIKIE